MALLLAAGEALVDVALSAKTVHLQVVHGALDVLDPGAQRGDSPSIAVLAVRRKFETVTPGTSTRLLHGEEAGAGALVDAHLEHVLAVGGPRRR